MSDVEKRYHETWLGMVQPIEGLVFSVPVLVDVGAMERTTPDVQEKFRAHLVEKDGRLRVRDLPALLLQRVGRFVLSEALDADYLFLWINSPHFTEQIDPGRSNGVPHISSKQVEAAVLFLPPLAEQHRIVVEVNELMALCDRVEASLDDATTTRRCLLDALLAEALAPTEVRDREAAE